MSYYYYYKFRRSFDPGWVTEVKTDPRRRKRIELPEEVEIIKEPIPEPVYEMPIALKTAVVEQLNQMEEEEDALILILLN